MKRLKSFATIPAMLLGIVLGIVMGVFSMPAFAVDASGAFELDGNADEQGLAGDDWETLKSGGGSQTEFTFLVDKNGMDNIFTGGGSKTPKDPEDWVMEIQSATSRQRQYHQCLCGKLQCLG